MPLQAVPQLLRPGVFSIDHLSKVQWDPVVGTHCLHWGQRVLGADGGRVWMSASDIGGNWNPAVPPEGDRERSQLGGGFCIERRFRALLRHVDWAARPFTTE